MNPFNSPEFDAKLLVRAASLLSAEVSRLQLGRPLAAFGEPSTPGPLSALEGLYPAGAGRAGSPDLFKALLASPKVEDLRRQATDLLESLMAAVGQNNSGVQSTAERVPLVSCAAPVRAGASASASLRVTNEEATPCDVSFYSSNFVSDSGYEMPSLLISVVPRRASILPGAEVTFEIKIAVPAQATSGQYSGLVQAAGSKYVKAVVMFDVL